MQREEPQQGHMITSMNLRTACSVGIPYFLNIKKWARLVVPKHTSTCSPPTNQYRIAQYIGISCFLAYIVADYLCCYLAGMKVLASIISHVILGQSSPSLCKQNDHVCVVLPRKRAKHIFTLNVHMTLATHNFVNHLVHVMHAYGYSSPSPYDSISKHVCATTKAFTWKFRYKYPMGIAKGVWVFGRTFPFELRLLIVHESQVQAVGWLVVHT